MMRFFLFLWILILIFFSYEYWALNNQVSLSSFHYLLTKGYISFKVSPEPGRPLSLWLGWIGLSLMIVMNLYSMRKRFDFMHGLGDLKAWLNFHVFCGLLGPTLILFHCNFIVHGLVAISFWSMVVSFTSGIVGRYFYIQLVGKKVELEKDSEQWMKRLTKGLAKYKIDINDKLGNQVLQNALSQAGFRESTMNPLSALFLSLGADFRFMFVSPKIPKNWPRLSKTVLKNFAVSKRKAQFLESFQSLMGYWHSFHFPFAMFMYLVAAIHVAAALVFGTGN